MTFCTIGKEGVEARSVVLRNFDKDKNIIRFHTDYRSPKLGDIKRNPNQYNLELANPERRQITHQARTRHPRITQTYE